MLGLFKRVSRHASPRISIKQLMTISSVLPPDGSVPTVSHNMSVEKAAQMMAEYHVDAIPVVKDERVVGLFTERDYFDKVLNTQNQATRSSTVGEVGLMGPELVVARPNDSVADCLAVMTKKNLMTLPVVEHDGKPVGTVSLLELTREYLDAQMVLEQTAIFSEPSMFPENLVTPDGSVHEEEFGDVELLQLATDPTDAILEHTDHGREEQAADMFSEGSVFPEFTAVEEVLVAEAESGAKLSPLSLAEIERQERFLMAQSEVLDRLAVFTEPSDFPEAAPIDEAVFIRV